MFRDLDLDLRSNLPCQPCVLDTLPQRLDLLPDERHAKQKWLAFDHSAHFLRYGTIHSPLKQRPKQLHNIFLQILDQVLELRRERVFLSRVSAQKSGHHWRGYRQGNGVNEIE